VQGGGSGAAPWETDSWLHRRVAIDFEAEHRNFTNLEHPHNKIERSILKVILWTVGVIFVVSVSGVVGYQQFRAWQQRRLIAEACGFPLDDRSKALRTLRLSMRGIALHEIQRMSFGKAEPFRTSGPQSRKTILLHSSSSS